jgi:hypothetical protein
MWDVFSSLRAPTSTISQVCWRFLDDNTSPSLPPQLDTGCSGALKIGSLSSLILTLDGKDSPAGTAETVPGAGKEKETGGAERTSLNAQSATVTSNEKGKRQPPRRGNWLLVNKCRQQERHPLSTDSAELDLQDRNLSELDGVREVNVSLRG